MAEALFGLLGVVVGALIGYVLTPLAAKKIRRQERQEEALGSLAQVALQISGEVSAFLGRRSTDLDSVSLHWWWTDKVHNRFGEFLHERWALASARAQPRKLRAHIHAWLAQMEACEPVMGFSAYALEGALFGETSPLSSDDAERVREELRLFGLLGSRLSERVTRG